jgi:hypothetical protein
VQVLIDIAKERESGRENKDAKSRSQTEEQDEGEFSSIRHCH